MVSLSPDRKDFVPEEIVRHEFSSSFRGYDQTEVRAYLAKVSAHMRALHDREALLNEHLEAAEARAKAAETPDEATLTAMLGEETTKILDAARNIAQEIRTKAEVRTAALVREAQEEATRITRETDELKRSSAAKAEALAASITRDAEANRDKILAEGNVAAEAILADANAEATALREEANSQALARETEAEARLAAIDAEVEAAVDEGRRQGREMVAEARLVRERILADLSQRRNAARAQLEQLRAARERLLEAYGVVRRTLDEATNELAVAMPEARRAAEAAARKAKAELAAATVDDVEAEIELARMAGLLRPESTPQHDEAASDDHVVLAASTTEETAVWDGGHVEEIEDSGAEDVSDTPNMPQPDSTDEVFSQGNETEGAGDDLLEEVLSSSESALVEQASEVLDAMVARADREEAQAVDEIGLQNQDIHGEEHDFVDINAVVGPDISGLFARLRAEVPPEPLAENVPANLTSKEELSVEQPHSSNKPNFGASDDSERFFELRDVHLETLTKRLSSLLKRALSDDENEKMDLARRLLAKEGVGAVVGEAHEHRGVYTESVAETIAEILAAGNAFVNELHGETGGQFDKSAHEHVHRLSAEIVDLFLVPLRNRLENLDEDVDEDEIPDLIRAVFRPWRSQIEGIAAAGAHAAFNQGVFDSIADEAAVRWLNDESLGPCPDGEDNALAGVVTKGEAFPTGHMHPPAHSRCCCLLIPVNR